MFKKVEEKLGVIAFISKIKYKRYKDKYFKLYVLRRDIPCFIRGSDIFTCEEFLEKLIFKDEKWNYIKNIHRMFMYKSVGINMKVVDNICDNNKAKKVSRNSLLIKSKEMRDDWIYYVLNNTIEGNYVFEFNSIIYTKFTEFQIAFKHKSIAERYRFRVIDNSILVFETIHGGFFLNEIKKVSFSFQLGQNYNIKLLVRNNIYSLIIDDKVLMTIEDKAKLLDDGGIALIFWDDSLASNSNINLLIEEPHLYSVA